MCVCFCEGVPLLDGGTVCLPQLIGLSRALDLILSGRPVKAGEALSMGLANRVVQTGAGISCLLLSSFAMHFVCCHLQLSTKLKILNLVAVLEEKIFEHNMLCYFKLWFINWLIFLRLVQIRLGPPKVSGQMLLCDPTKASEQ